MKFKTRSTRITDLAACQRLLSDRHLYSESELELLTRFWSELLTGGCAYSGVGLEGSEDTIIAFSISVFVSDELAERMHRGALPYIGRTMLRSWMKGTALYLLDREIGACNAGSGVNVVTIHSGYRPFASVDQYADLRMSLVDVFIREHIGLHMRSFTHELYGEYKEAIQAGGLRIQEYDPLQYPEIAGDLSERRPFVTSLSRSGAAGQRGNYLSDTMTFAHTTPRFRFSLAQRQLLRAALENDSDEHLAECLALSLPAIKKRWASIYEVIERIEPGVLGEEERVSGRRGQERRRKVIGYLRDCPEELHAFYQAADQAGPGCVSSRKRASIS